MYQDAQDAGTIITTVVLDTVNGAKKNKPTRLNVTYAVEMPMHLVVADMFVKIDIRQTMTDKKKNAVRLIWMKMLNIGGSNANGKKKTDQSGNYKVSKPK